MGEGHDAYGSRKRGILELFERGIVVDLYGSGWNILEKLNKGEVHDEQVVNTLNRYKYGLDFSEVEPIPKRVLEYAGCGCVPVVKEPALFYDLFALDEMLFVDDDFMNKNGEEVMLRAYKKVYRCHTQKNRAKFVMDAVDGKN